MENNFYRSILLYIFKWLLISFLLGFLGANLVFLLRMVINYLRNIVSHSYILTPVIGGLLVGLIIYYFDFRSEGLGTNRYIDFAHQDGNIEGAARLLFTKFSNTSITLGLMGVEGLVGPILLMGSSLAVVVEQLALGLNIEIVKDRTEHRVLNICGAAATLGSLLGAPIGSGIFASEVLYQSSLEYDDLFPAILAGSFGSFFYNYFYSGGLLSYNINLPNLAAVDVLLVVIVALIAGLLGQGIILIYKRCYKLFEEANMNLIFKPILAGLIVALLIKLFQINEIVDKLKIEQLLFSGLAVKALLALLIFKIVTTIIVVSSGGSVAMFDTALVIGGLLGNLLYYVIPLPLNVLVVTGISAILSSVANVPLAAMILVLEIFGINLSLAVVLGSIIGFLVGRAGTVYQYLELE
ncbi:MAG: chloride channel protein [Bacillota bacterium]